MPCWLLLLLAWGAGTLVYVHGGLYFVVGVLALSGAIRVGTPLLVLRWYTFLWGPWWLLEGMLVLLAAWIGLRSSPHWRAGLGFGYQKHSLYKRISKAITTPPKGGSSH